MANYNVKTFLGWNHDNQRIYLFAPQWACGWYWSFGNIGNSSLLTHIDCLKDRCNLYDGIKKYFKDFKITDENDIWQFCDLFVTFYQLRETAEVYHRGGSNYSSHPILKDVIINEEERNRINNVILPNIFKEIYNILHKYVK